MQKTVNSKHCFVLFNCYIGPLSGATTPGQSGPVSDGNKGVLRIPQSSSITGTSPSDCLMSSPGHSLGDLTHLQRSSRCILQPQPTGQAIVGLYWINLKQSIYCVCLIFFYNLFCTTMERCLKPERLDLDPADWLSNSEHSTSNRSQKELKRNTSG